MSIPPPKTLHEAKQSPWPQYRVAEVEIDGHEENATWTLVPITEVPRGKSILRGKFVFDDKRGEDGKFFDQGTIRCNGIHSTTRSGFH